MAHDCTSYPKKTVQGMIGKNFHFWPPYSPLLLLLDYRLCLQFRACLLQVLSSVGVVGSTCASSTSIKLAHSIVILDEASQTTEASSLLPLVHVKAKMVMLVGDPQQLPPTVSIFLQAAFFLLSLFLNSIYTLSVCLSLSIYLSIYLSLSLSSLSLSLSLSLSSSVFVSPFLLHCLSFS